MDLDGSRILVVGGSSGIGRAVAQAALEAGGQVVIASRSQDRLDAARAALGEPVRTLVLDATHGQGLASSLEQEMSASGPFDHVVVTAAQLTLKPFLEMSVAEAQAGFESKFWGSYRVALLSKPRGSLTLTSGTYAHRPQRGAVHVAAMNSAIEGLVRALAVELAPVRVNCVCPGITATERFAHLEPGARQALLSQAAQRTALGRVAQPQDLAQAYLLCLRNPHLTGQTLVVDGGGLLV